MTRRERAAHAWLFATWVPALRRIIAENSDPEVYAQWNGNCCRQAAISGAWTLEQLLPDYVWHVYHGVFVDVVYGQVRQYDHAWNWGVPVTGLPLFVDLGRVHHEQVFMHSEQNAYPTTGDYRNMRRLRFEEMDWRLCLGDVEYYTQWGGLQLAKRVAEAAGLDAFMAKLATVEEVQDG